LSEISQDTPKDSKGKIFIRTIGVQSLDHHFAALFQCLNGFVPNQLFLFLEAITLAFPVVLSKFC
jgi:hypothetical protein